MEGTPLTARELSAHLGQPIKKSWEFVLTPRGELFKKQDDGTWMAYPSYEEQVKRCSANSVSTRSG